MEMCCRKTAGLSDKTAIYLAHNTHKLLLDRPHPLLGAYLTESMLLIYSRGCETLYH